MLRTAFLQGNRALRNCPSALKAVSYRPTIHCDRPRITATTITTTHTPSPRTYVTKSTADEKIEELQELYATAKDEFEIASEETDKKTVYAADDRAAAQEELAKLKTAFKLAVNEEGGEEIKARIGQRIRELDRAVEALEERAMED